MQNRNTVFRFEKWTLKSHEISQRLCCHIFHSLLHMLLKKIYICRALSAAALTFLMPPKLSSIANVHNSLFFAYNYPQLNNGGVTQTDKGDLTNRHEIESGVPQIPLK